MANSAHCETCGRSLDDSSNGLCPNCLLRTAIDYGLTPALVPSLPKLRYFGDYELLEEIARGGMGVVYRARQVSLDRTVALKMMRPGLLATPAEIQRFHAEAKTAAGLQHPNIVAIHEVGEIDGLHYFSMDFVDGLSLAELVRDRALSPLEAGEYVKSLAETVQYAHTRGILHRDLKPSNVLVDAAGRPRITDFGLARPLDTDSTATVNGAVVGTPAYMPPEQATGNHQKLGPASDVYSLGAILYELLTGIPPFRGATQFETVRMVIDERPTSPRKLKASVSLALETVCLRCLEKEPARRYASARELVADLDHALRGERIGRAIPRWTWIAAAALIVAMLVFLLLTVRTEKRVAITIIPAPEPGSAIVAKNVSPPPPSKPAAALPPITKAPKKVAPKAPAAYAASVSPSTGRAYDQTFLFRYETPDGAPKIAAVQIDFHQTAGDRTRDCNVYIELESRRAGLQYDPESGPNLRKSGSIGTLVLLENAVCKINLADLAIEANGTQLEVRLPVAFKPDFEGKTDILSWPSDDRGQRGENRIHSNWIVGQP
jgi:hypothetical protein